MKKAADSEYIIIIQLDRVFLVFISSVLIVSVQHGMFDVKADLLIIFILYTTSSKIKKLPEDAFV